LQNFRLNSTIQAVKNYQSIKFVKKKKSMKNSEIDYFQIKTNSLTPEKGQILIAEPFLNDIYFKRSIILLVEHNDEGTVGFVLNKPININVNEIIKDFPKYETYLSIGGPVNTNTIHYIHTLGKLIPNSVQVRNDLWWGGDFDIIKELVELGKIEKNQIIFFLGYSGWKPGQLKDELMQNSWLVGEIDTHTLMSNNKNTLWADTLRNMGEIYKMWINSPENPSIN
jgi:putative transcriptional regulator